jgi:hypothetical protein
MGPQFGLVHTIQIDILSCPSTLVMGLLYIGNSEIIHQYSFKMADPHEVQQVTGSASDLFTPSPSEMDCGLISLI